MSLADDAAQAFERGKRGVSPRDGPSEALRQHAPAWALVLDAQRWAADPALADAPTVARIAEHDPAIAWRACVELGKTAVLALDSVVLGEACGLLQQFASADRRAALWSRAMNAWNAIARGEPVTLEESVGADARALGDAELVIEVEALRALVALETADLDTGRALARRASRMARTEALPQAEYLANIVLARLRRLAGYPHLAGRILEALEGLASPRWHRWIRWEKELAGAGGGPGDDPAAALATMRERAAAGARDAFDDAVADVHARAAGFAPIAREAELFVVACDPDAEHVPEALGPWCEGRDPHAPLGLYAPDDSGSLGYVAARPGSGGRRILPPGAGLFDGPLLPRKKRKQSRVETLVSVLALAGDEGLDEAVAFREVYGFALVPELHRGTFDVTQHRARAYVESVGSLAREGSQVRLVLEGPVLVPDPRCVEPVEGRLLRAIAGGATTAKAAANAAGVSLRQAQAALQALVDEGACLAEKDGRRLAYRVEDTTFAEPTRHE